MPRTNDSKRPSPSRHQPEPAEHERSAQVSHATDEADEEEIAETDRRQLDDADLQRRKGPNEGPDAGPDA